MIKRVIIIILAIILIFVGISTYLKKDETNKVVDRVKVNEKNDNDVGSTENEEIENQVVVDSIMQFDSKGGIDVGVIFYNIVEEDNDYIVFKVMVNNHRIDLEDIKYDELSSLMTSDGITIKDGFQWQLLGGGGHHISGLLKVSKVYNGDNIINENTDYIQLEFNGIGNSENMKFKWDKEVLEIFNKNKQ